MIVENFHNLLRNAVQFATNAAFYLENFHYEISETLNYSCG